MNLPSSERKEKCGEGSGRRVERGVGRKKRADTYIEY